MKTYLYMALLVAFQPISSKSEFEEPRPPCADTLWKENVIEHSPDSAIAKAIQFYPIDKITPVEGMLAEYFIEFSLNGKTPVYSRNQTNTYYCSFPLETMGNHTEMACTIAFLPKNKLYKVYLNNNRIENSNNYLINDLNADMQLTLQVLKNDSILATFYLIPTGLPIVQIYCNDCNGIRYVNGYIRVHDPDQNTVPLLINAFFRYRGAITVNHPKKSYSIKLKDSKGNKYHHSFLGFREDNNWILDAMTVDPLRMRNRVSMDLWNDFSTPPHYAAWENNVRTGTRGRYVELFLNNEYRGLYCLSEKIDRKQLKLKKFDDDTRTVKGLLYKSVNWTYSTLMGHYADSKDYLGASPPDYSNDRTTWDGYEMKYPDYGDGQDIDWKPLWQFVNFVAATGRQTFIDEVDHWLDFPVWLDYSLFQNLILGTDNYGKNLFIYCYDIQQSERMGVAPWDLDGVWGIRWESSKTLAYPEQDYIDYIQKYKGEYVVFKRLREYNIHDYQTQWLNRYRELRMTWFSERSLLNRFETYKDLFDRSGAGKREAVRWNVDLNAEMKYITSWIQRRLNYLDERFMRDNNVSLKNETISNVFFNKMTDELLIDNLTLGERVSIFDANGRLCHDGVATEEKMVVDMSVFLKGCYFLKTIKETIVFIK